MLIQSGIYNTLLRVSSQSFGVMLKYGSQAFMSLAGRIADSRQEVARLLEHPRSNSQLFNLNHKQE